MSIEKKAEWIAALRSGKYKQGKGWLYVGGKYCCLGVYCEVLGIEKKKSTGINSETIWQYRVDNATSGWTSTGIPKQIDGLDERACKILVRMNDNDVSFLDIAAWIEANL